ncbi:MAG: hypothetical protein Q9M91_00175 [Candidatus Dojkabacteria bacterium]|nr:hypothetical protein [Candidatus Dojkabacteria bacterium]
MQDIVNTVITELPIAVSQLVKSIPKHIGRLIEYDLEGELFKFSTDNHVLKSDSLEWAIFTQLCIKHVYPSATIRIISTEEGPGIGPFVLTVEDDSLQAPAIALFGDRMNSNRTILLTEGLDTRVINAINNSHPKLFSKLSRLKIYISEH